MDREVAEPKLQLAAGQLSEGGFPAMCVYWFGFVLLVLAKAIRTHETARRNARGGAGRPSLVGESPQMQDVMRVIDKQVADTPTTVLITGESGTGKELVARALHENSSRKDKPFIKVNCAAIPKDLMESRALRLRARRVHRRRHLQAGRFELADGGTLFLDEIGEIPVEMQVKLLRALQESEFERVGGIKTIRVDVRLVAATNRDLQAEIAAGRSARICTTGSTSCPSLCPRSASATATSPLARHFVDKFNARLKKKVEGIDRRRDGAAQAYAWPGNIRELENVIERPCSSRTARKSCTICLMCVAERDRRPEPRAGSPGAARSPAGEAGLKDIVEQKAAELERDLIAAALEETGGNVTRAAKLLQISRKSLQTKMKELSLREDGGE